MQPKIKTGNWMDRGMARWICDTANSEVVIVTLSGGNIATHYKILAAFLFV